MAESIGIVWDGLREFRDRIDEILDKADVAARKVVIDGGHLIERRAKQKAPVKTGTLRRSIHVDSVKRLGIGRWESNTGPSVIYARLREFGTAGLPGGVLRPINASVLSWMGPNGPVFAQSVYQKGKPYMKPAFDESIGGLRELYRVAFREALES